MKVKIFWKIESNLSKMEEELNAFLDPGDKGKHRVKSPVVRFVSQSEGQTGTVGHTTVIVWYD